MMVVNRIESYGNQLKLYYDDGTTALAYPTTGGLWYISAPTGGGGGGGIGGDKFSWPFSLTTVSSEYGPRSGPIGSFHEGIDFSGGSASYGAKVFASNDGTVEKVNINNNYGYSVQLGHGTDSNGAGLHTLYAHFNQNPSVSVGDNVTKGQLLGYLGASGDALGAHTHFETHTCPGNGPIVHNTHSTASGLDVRTAINPRNFMQTYGDGGVFPQ